MKHRLLEISRAAKAPTEASRRRLRESYRQLLALSRKVVQQAGTVMEKLKQGKLPMIGSLLQVAVQTSQMQPSNGDGKLAPQDAIKTYAIIEPQPSQSKSGLIPNGWRFFVVEPCHVVPAKARTFSSRLPGL